MHSSEEYNDCGSSSCGCAREPEEKSIRPILIRTFIAGILVAISVITEQGIFSTPEIAIYSSIIALLLTAYPILKEAVSGLIGGERNVCELASIAIVGALLIGEFTAAAEVAIILTVGELAEAYTYARSKGDIRGILARNPRYGYVIRNKEIIPVPVREILVGERVMIRPGDMIPVDGIVIEGGSWLDESCLTGESLPVRKEKGSTAYSGSINADETLILQATSISDESTYSRIVALIREAGMRRPPIHPFIDRFARIYSPFMILTAGIVFLLTGSILRAITVLIVACPCSLMLATPSAILATLGSAARKGIFMKSGEFLEICNKISVLVMDKTGTITTGKMQISEIQSLAELSTREILTHAVKAECSSSHPVGKAIIHAASHEGIPISCGGNTRHYSGLGVEDLQDGHPVHVGNYQFMNEQGVSIPDHLKIDDSCMDGNISVLVAVDRALIGIIRIADSIRPESEQVVSWLKKLGISRIEILTGDNHHIASKIAELCKISPAAVHAGMYPRDKEQYIADLQKKGEVVCFVGDGTNDGPALARADLGVSIGSREDTIALETSGVILMQEGLSALPDFISLGRRTSRIIMINVVLALGLNFLLICGAASGVLSPVLGAIGHQVATLLVLMNSARLAYAPGREEIASQSGCNEGMACTCGFTLS
jgi:Zn2+/Cd2+-exporting ATPase